MCQVQTEVISHLQWVEVISDFALTQTEYCHLSCWALRWKSNSSFTGSSFQGYVSHWRPYRASAIGNSAVTVELVSVNVAKVSVSSVTNASRQLMQMQLESWSLWIMNFGQIEFATHKQVPCKTNDLLRQCKSLEAHLKLYGRHKYP